MATAEGPRAADGEPAGAGGGGGESLADLLGGRRGAVDATLPPVAFAVGWLAAGGSVWVGVAAALAVGLAVAGWRLLRGDRPRSVLIGLLAVAVAALVVLRTGRASDFFLLQLLANVASALVWVISVVIRWPLLGVVVGSVLGQRTRWRRDPALLRAYGRGSWIWAGSYALRVAVFAPLYLADQVVALAAARVALSWPLVALCLAVSWRVIRRSLPPGHPGLRHPRPAAAGGSAHVADGGPAHVADGGPSGGPRPAGDGGGGPAGTAASTGPADPPPT